MSSPLRIMIAGGGTGGHVFPALALAEELQRCSPNAEVCFVGTARGMEARVLPGLGHRLELLEVKPLKGQGAAGLMKGAAAIPLALVQAQKLLSDFRPDVVVSVGGYAAGPVTLAAALRGIPTALMEQNAAPGLTNRILGRFAKRCFLSMEIVGGLPPQKCEVVGNPVRQSILDSAKKDIALDHDRRESFRIFVTGGSGGAGAINKHLPQLFKKLDNELATRVTMKHQAGRNRDAQVREDYKGFAGQVEVVEFVEDMSGAYQWADLVICRSGATTLAELMVLGQPSMLIPFAGAADNHQEKNALQATRSGAAVMVLEEDLKGDKLVKILRGLMHNPESLDKMRAQAQTLGNPEAANTIVHALAALAGKEL